MFETVFPFVTALVISELFTKLILKRLQPGPGDVQIHVWESLLLLRRKQCVNLIIFADLGKFLISIEGGIL